MEAYKASPPHFPTGLTEQVRERFQNYSQLRKIIVRVEFVFSMSASAVAPSSPI